MVRQQALLAIQNLGRQVEGRWLWRHVTFTLRGGESLGLVAPSGAGKTLLLRSIILLDPIQEGQITFAGKSLKEWTLPLLRSQVIYLPQRATALSGTVENNLQQVFKFKVNQHTGPLLPSTGVALEYDPDRILTWLSQLGRSGEFLRQPASQLSGGEAQILALLRALQLEPQVLLLDEPTASLDADSTFKVEALLKNWLKGDNRACVVTSHDQHQIHRLTSRQLKLSEFC